MSQEFSVVLVDDFDGSEAVETIRFGLDGVNYEIDLSNSNAAKMRDALAPWVRHARRVGGRKQSSARSTGAKRTDLNEIRAWGRANGYTISDRGRVSAEVMKAYDTAH